MSKNHYHMRCIHIIITQYCLGFRFRMHLLAWRAYVLTSNRTRIMLSVHMHISEHDMCTSLHCDRLFLPIVNICVSFMRCSASMVVFALDLNACSKLEPCFFLYMLSAHVRNHSGIARNTSSLVFWDDDIHEDDGTATLLVLCVYCTSTCHYTNTKSSCA